MHGRIIEPFHFSGGTTEIQLGGTTRPVANKLFRASLARPGMVAVQLSCDRLTEVDSSARPVADIFWQVGSGGHEMTVDVGLGRSGTALVLSAAEIVEVTTRIEPIVNLSNSTGNQTLETTSSAFRMNGTAAPAAALAPHPALLTQTATVRASGTATSTITIPRWAKRFWLFSDLTGSADEMLTSTTATFLRTASGTVTMLQTWQDGIPFRVPGNASVMTLAQVGATDFDATIIWELEV